MTVKTTVACVQLNTGSDLEQNIAAVEALVREAHRQGATFMVLPENAFYMREGSERDKARFTMEEHPGFQHCTALAAELSCWILIGSLFAVVDDSGKWANRSVLIDATGRLASHYDKIHLFDADFGDGERYAESDSFISGAQAKLADVPFGQLGLTICYDVRFPRLFRDLAQAGATAFATPAAFAKRTGEAHWHVLQRSRAIENGCYVLAAAQCGSHPQFRKTYGHSMIVDPWGEVLAEADGETPQVIMAEIDPARVAQVRSHMPCLKHDRDYILMDYAI